MKRGRKSEPDRFRNWKVALFFLAAGIWLGGVVADQPLVTGAAIVLLLIAVGLRFVSDSEIPREGDSEEGEA